jgi:hypothetical protein
MVTTAVRQAYVYWIPDVAGNAPSYPVVVNGDYNKNIERSSKPLFRTSTPTIIAALMHHKSDSCV